MIAAPVQCDVDGVPKGSHFARVPSMGYTGDVSRRTTRPGSRGISERGRAPGTRRHRYHFARGWAESGDPSANSAAADDASPSFSTLEGVMHCQAPTADPIGAPCTRRGSCGRVHEARPVHPAAGSRTATRGGSPILTICTPPCRARKIGQEGREGIDEASQVHHSGDDSAARAWRRRVSPV